MSSRPRPMQRVLIVGCTVFVVLLSAALSVQSLVMYSSRFYAIYANELENVITAVEGFIDVDDLQECVHTRTESAAFDALQELVNTYVDDFDLAYLYLCVPYADGTMVSVCASTSAEEREAGDVEDWPILHEDTEYYDAETIVPYLEAWDSEGITYFEGDSGWGSCFTACKPIFASDGEQIALLCADVATEGMHRDINNYVVRSVALIVGIGVAAGCLLIWWLRRDVTGPVADLERSARDFAERCHGRRDPDMPRFEAPDIRTRNELASLAQAISQMSEDMRAYMEDVLLAEEQAAQARAEAEGMSRVAFEDPLTHVGSKAAYERRRTELEELIEAGEARFALVMVDLNDLKRINDTFGHDQGDVYIKGACRVVCRTFAHSAVYRVGGDEFVVVVEGADYDPLEELLAALEDSFGRLSADEALEPWERCSAAAGMARWEALDTCVEDVFKRADEAMYRAKTRMKGARGSRA